MNDDELKKLWQQQPLREPPSPAQWMSAMQKQTTRLRRSLHARDLRELAACAVIILIFGIFYFTVYREPMERLGVLIIIGGTIFIAWKLLYTRRAHPPAPPGASTIESLRAELKSVRAQSQLLRSIAWWYLLPLAVGLFVCTWGGPGGGLAGKIVYSIFVVALFAFIYRLNQRARVDQFVPLEAQLQSLLHSAETGQPLDQTHVANLRPIVLSMASADKVHPVEFKVAFGQLAIFGVPAFVAIWFFWMLSLTIDDRGSITNTPLETPAARAVFTGTTNRHSLVAREVVDLFNAGDYAAIHQLYNADMSEFFPPEQTSDFYTRLAARSGRIMSFDGPIENGYRGWTAFRLHFQRGEITLSLALDRDDKISGIHFLPAARPSESWGSFLHRLFSWQHLAWLPIFLLAGLIYSWIMQKLTTRAVGISVLGIHLDKGNAIVLWDEIKEVRPFRFLHIRNLWLIKESGEKTLMHWTPLERHPHLKEAIENSAPPNHPIRQYLSLLKHF